MIKKNWFITGASRGLGRVWMQAALERGDHVAATVRHAGDLSDLRSLYGDAVLLVELDVTDRAAVFAAVAQAHAHFGQLDVIVSAAGYGLFGAIEEVSIEQIRSNVETNLFGTLNVIQAALPLLRRQGSGHILPVTSIAGLVAIPTSGIYTATKFALEGLAESLAAEVSGLGIKVTLIEPMLFRTNFGKAVAYGSPIPEYDPVREVVAGLMRPEAFSDPEATAEAILSLVDAEEAPLRLMLGDALPFVRDVYAQRIKGWEAWDDVARAAQG
jgi:NAD(P)-dependent dehydrogenase (short-subunit alcohol dehydrogenase family)